MSESIKLYAPIKIVEATKEMREFASSVIKLPKGEDKQMDLMYFTGIFVSSGGNLNFAYFLPSELVIAENTIVNKALDIEHKEKEIVGHIYERAFITKDGRNITVEELANKEKASLDKEELHVLIAGVIYKHRFKDIAEEVSMNKWRLSMETYYSSYDVKIGDLIIPFNEAEFLGLTDKKYLGKPTKVIKAGKEVASGEAYRVLRGLCFSGCGLVENPANPASVILEVAGADISKGSIEISATGEVVIYLDKDKANNHNNVTSHIIDDTNKNSMSSGSDVVDGKDSAGSVDTDIGICVSYKCRVLDGEGADAKVVHENWCALYETQCTSFSKDTTDPNCLRTSAIKRIAEENIDKLSTNSKIKRAYSNLVSAIKKAETFLK